MAQTKAKPKKRSAPKRAKSSSKPKASKAKPKSASKAHSNGSSSKHSNVEAVRNAVGDVGGKAKDAGKTVGKAASKAKVPLVAGGAAIAGAAGGLALASKHGRKSGLAKAMPRRPKIKVDSKDVAKAARGVGSFSAQVSEIAGGLESAASGRNGKHRSPIEVVLQGLTARR
ncbi:MAG TPA: hypothetical protein VFT79_02800 [Solirubrobacterales bacterium]|nr:hypothetical protein [Solirubrobacterales bacterium]